MIVFLRLSWMCETSRYAVRDQASMLCLHVIWLIKSFIYLSQTYRCNDMNVGRSGSGLAWGSWKLLFVLLYTYEWMERNISGLGSNLCQCENLWKEHAVFHLFSTDKLNFAVLLKKWTRQFQVFHSWWNMPALFIAQQSVCQPHSGHRWYLHSENKSKNSL